MLEVSASFLCIIRSVYGCIYNTGDRQTKEICSVCKQLRAQ